ncbi:MAG: sugar phosphate nucleotidyltransferase [Thermoplasmata archaeon]
MQAIILAGGLGTRLRPVTYFRPKALVPLLNRPMVLHIIDGLPREVDEVIIAASYMIEALEEFFDTHTLDVGVTIVDEEEPLGTGGALKNLEGLVHGTFLAVNGDVISSLMAGDLVEFHRRKGGMGAIALWEVENPEAFGIVGLNEDGRIERFLEKPSRAEVFSKFVNAGVYVLEEDILKLIPQGRAVSLEREVFPKAIERGFYGMTFHGYWADAGTLDNYLAATRILMEEGGSRLEKGCVIHPEAGILDPVVTGAFSVLRGGIVGPYVCLGRGCSIASAKVANAVLFDEVRVEEGVIIEESLIGSGATIGGDSRIQGCIVADDARIERGSKLIGEQVGR